MRISQPVAAIHLQLEELLESKADHHKELVSKALEAGIEFLELQKSMQNRKSPAVKNRLGEKNTKKAAPEWLILPSGWSGENHETTADPVLLFSAATG